MMPAKAARTLEREDLARSLRSFANALCGQTVSLLHQRRGDGFDENEADPLAEAITAARSAQNPPGARILAYRMLVSRFLSMPTTAATFGRRHAVAPRPAATALAARPQITSQAEQTLDALRHLAPIERAALVLVAAERFTYADAAIVMDMERLEFVQALARAREAFAARLAKASASRTGHLRLVD